MFVLELSFGSDSTQRLAARPAHRERLASLKADGIVVRESSPTDRRAWIVRLTPKGRRLFDGMASEHEGWILELFAGLDAKAVRQLHAQLGHLRVHLLKTDPVTEDT